MYEALTVLADLSHSDREWIFDVGIEQHFDVETNVITEGSIPESVFIVLNGLLAAYVEPLGKESVGTIGIGEIVGEMSMLENSPASATLVTLEPTRVLSILRSDLAARIREDAEFAARLYRALAKALTRRLPDRVSFLGSVIAKRNDDPFESGNDKRWEGVQRPMDAFRDLLSEADDNARKHGEVSPETTARARELFDTLCGELTRAIGHGSSAHAHEKQALGARARRELLPLILLSKCGERWHTKPRGYAGDYTTIQLIYDNQPRGTSRLGPLVDEILLGLAPARATRNRRRLIADAIRRDIDGKAGEATHVTCFACGPAAEVFDVFDSLDDPASLKINLIDVDLQALDVIREQRAASGLEHQISLAQGNLVYLAMGRQELTIEPQDLIYSMGLIDYFNDKFVVKLLNYVHERLRTGGRVLLGNIHKRNPVQAFQDHVLDWRLVHRDEQDMDRLFRASAFRRKCTDVLFEDAGIHFFSECVKS